MVSIDGIKYPSAFDSTEGRTNEGVPSVFKNQIFNKLDI